MEEEGGVEGTGKIRDQAEQSGSALATAVSRLSYAQAACNLCMCLHSHITSSQACVYPRALRAGGVGSAAPCYKDPRSIGTPGESMLSLQGSLHDWEWARVHHSKATCACLCGQPGGVRVLLGLARGRCTWFRNTHMWSRKGRMRAHALRAPGWWGCVCCAGQARGVGMLRGPAMSCA